MERAQPSALLAQSSWTARLPQPLEAWDRVHVLALGKAAHAMVQALRPHLPGAQGVVVVPRGPVYAPLPGFSLIEAGHPIPDANSVGAGEALLDHARSAQAGSLVLVLLSGGGSALGACPVEGLALPDLQQTVQVLLRGGADIASMNVVRKHLIRLGGGQLAAAPEPAHCLTLVISDVVGEL